MRLQNIGGYIPDSHNIDYVLPPSEIAIPIRVTALGTADLRKTRPPRRSRVGGVCGHLVSAMRHPVSTQPIAKILSRLWLSGRRMALTRWPSVGATGRKFSDIKHITRPSTSGGVTIFNRQKTKNLT